MYFMDLTTKGALVMPSVTKQLQSQSLLCPQLRFLLAFDCDFCSNKASGVALRSQPHPPSNISVALI